MDITALNLVSAIILSAGVSNDGAAWEARLRHVAEQRSSASAVSQRHGRLIRAREAYLAQGRAIANDVAAWQRAAHSWLQGWLGVLALAELREGWPYAEFESRLRRMMREQTSAIEVLRRQGVELRERVNGALAIVHEETAPPSNEHLAEYADLLAAMLAQEDALREALTASGETLADKLEKLERIDTLSRRGVLAKLEVALVNSAVYPMMSTLSQVTELLTAEAVLGPTLERLRRAEHDMNTYALNLYAYHAEETYQESRMLCEQAEESHPQHGGASEYHQWFQGRARQLCQAIEGHYEAISTLPISKAVLVRELIRTERPELAAMCRIPSGSVSPLECEKLAVLASLRPESFEEMDERELRFVERAWVGNLEAARKTIRQ